MRKERLNNIMLYAYIMVLKYRMEIRGETRTR
jgi:hypothetical protein